MSYLTYTILYHNKKKQYCIFFWSTNYPRSEKPTWYL